MLIAHATDIHWFCEPKVSDLSFKRILGTANLVLRGRKNHFSESAQAALVRHVASLKPDLFIISGDLTAQALPSEFALAREALQPVLEDIPTFVVPGNHDLYTLRSLRERTMEETFSHWMHLQQDGIGRLDIGDVTVLGLDPNRPTWINATGVVPTTQLEALEQNLNDASIEANFVILVIHYPVVGPSGSLYDNWHHGLLNVSELVATLNRSKRVPDLIVHGHKHHGYKGILPLENGRSIPTYNCGSSGYAADLGSGRAAATNLYKLESGSLAEVTRYIFDGEQFQQEPGGLYQSGI